MSYDEKPQLVPQPPPTGPDAGREPARIGRRSALALLGGLAGATGVAAIPGTAHATGARTGSAAGAGSRSAAAMPSPQPNRPPARLSLPVPGGPLRLGCRQLRLVDTARPDPWHITPGAPRELMVSVHYPARPGLPHPAAPELPPTVAAAMNGYQPGGVPPGLIDWAATTTHSDLDAPAEPHRRHPVVLYSPGVGDPRGLGTVLAEELASWGYLVISIDHTYETYVEFPGGRLVGPELLAQAPPPDAPDAALAAFLRKLVGVRVADSSFVLDRLDDIGSQVGAPIDTGRVGMVGHSAGGFTALQAAYDDCRLRAAADLDGELNFGHEDLAGTPMSTVTEHGLDRPFLLIGSKSGGHRDPQSASWGLLWRASRGWRRDLYLRGAAHTSFTDLEPLVGRLAACGGIDAATRGQVIGTVPATEAVGANRSAVRSFFDTTLRGRSDGLLDKPQRRFPDLIRRG